VSAEISVVIPTHDRPAGLARLLEALDRQGLSTNRYEVIVCDDGSTVPVAIPAGREPPVTVVRHAQPRGPGAARNSGWRRAGAPIVAFIDDDCVPTYGWLEALVGAADQTPGPAVLQGQIRPSPAQEAELGPLSHTIEVTGPSRLFVSANIAYSRSLLEQLGGFDERFTKAAEDAELGARAMQAGAQARFVADALVHHDVRRLGLGEHIRHTLKWSDAVRAVGMHPELRELLIARVFWKPTHPWLLGIMAALAARRRGWAVILALGYLRHYWRLYGADPGAVARALPTHLAIDSAEIATVAAGSLRHRTLML
jgi:glycosyltransferase involved in cell wall biosynthesis